MAIYSSSNTMIPADVSGVKSVDNQQHSSFGDSSHQLSNSATPASDHVNLLDVAHDLNSREDALLRRGNGIIDQIVFPRLVEAMGISGESYHRVVMGLVRSIQWSRDFDGPTAKLLGVVRCGVNGTAAEPRACACQV